ncbi:5-(carboxyamino)imidazole ribonucleotide synthase [Pasteurellaceae bacterium HPA106]|uniref:5-(carboxyamino)imidazole ribonucleotide synthase n=1 Tax=Spirabiliibacterium pneumoniae TaxID=221400 RepID=UPI001AAE0AF7|nr:5-(carboxyamino)imidazole ribonucleotide synthase [Spirabiliibacterium pneumoniae]MBE2895690.1 5-(carboxyamino)imidazole ribonucleotide synthase [Spirabiliibacterium pneumoniae]
MMQSALYPPIFVLGNGQLGRMLRYAGCPLDIDVRPLGFDEPHFALPESAVITAEIERWPHTQLTDALSTHPNFVNKPVFARLADRLTQKQLLDELHLATSPWALLTSPEDLDRTFTTIGEKLVVKRRTGGYDGRGQWIINAENTDEITDDLFGEVIAEQFIPFDYEISLVGARFRDGSTRFYPITHNLQQEGILRYSVTHAKLPHLSALQTQAEQMLTPILNALDYVGVMAMECFVLGDKLIINELAPRVHNSGHWTQLGANISQFELHLRALLNLPTPPLERIMPSVMVNLIGSPHNPQWLRVPHSQLHWYGKAVRPGRKLGHINIAHPDQSAVIKALNTLSPLLEENYQSGLIWAMEKLR